MAALYPALIGPAPVARFTNALIKACRDADLSIAVPTCGEWTLADLVWHMTEVQDFWTYILAIRPSGGPKYYEQPKRSEKPRLVANLGNALAGLSDALRSASPDETAWTWSEDQTVGFILRRQTHEALTHYVDALLALDLPLPDIDPELAADGVDEIVHVILEPEDDGGTGSITLHATDTDDRWTINLGEGDCTIAGKALDLNLWLWGRGKTWPLTFRGNSAQAATLRAKLSGDTQ